MNLRRLYQLQLSKFVSSETLFSDMFGLIKNFSNLDDENDDQVLEKEDMKLKKTDNERKARYIDL